MELFSCPWLLREQFRSRDRFTKTILKTAERGFKRKIHRERDRNTAAPAPNPDGAALISVAALKAILRVSKREIKMWSLIY